MTDDDKEQNGKGPVTSSEPHTDEKATQPSPPEGRSRNGTTTYYKPDILTSMSDFR